MVSTGGDWIYWLVGGLLAVAGGVLLLWAWLWDRSRGRLRCPKCWYPMEGVPAGPVGVDDDGRATGSAWTCPECGKRTLGEGKLRKTRRRKRWASLAVAMLVAAWGVWKLPEARRRGLVSYVPTTILILTHELAYKYNWGGSDVGGELLLRVYDGKVSSWQLAEIAPPELGRMVEVYDCPEWPAGESVWAGINPARFFAVDEECRVVIFRARLPDAEPVVCVPQTLNKNWTTPQRIWDFRADRWLAVERSATVWFRTGYGWSPAMSVDRLGTPEPGATEILVDWSVQRVTGDGPDRKPSRKLWSGTFHLPLVTDADEEDDGVGPLRSAAADDAVRRDLVTGIEVAGDPAELLIHVDRPSDAVLRDVVVSAQVVLEFERREIGSAYLMLAPEDGREDRVVVVRPRISTLPAMPTDPRLRLRIRSFPAPAILYLRTREYWSGDVEMPLSEILERPSMEDAGP